MMQLIREFRGESYCTPAVDPGVAARSALERPINIDGFRVNMTSGGKMESGFFL
jgi:hypothetical protein